MKFTVFGNKGFIGQSMANYLMAKGYTVDLPSRSAKECLGQDLGHVIYAIGLTGDFRTRPFDTVEAHVCKLVNLLSQTRFESWLFLSSTRVYEGLSCKDVAKEDLALPVLPGLDGVYNISKLLGEALCLSQLNEKVRVVRLSNVYGHGQSRSTFLASIMNELVRSGDVLIREAPESFKDYIALVDILPIIEAIAVSGKERVYNLASGKVVTHDELADCLAQITGGTVRFKDKSPCRKFPLIDISRIQSEFKFIGSCLQKHLPDLIETIEAENKGDCNYENSPA